ncbi:MAG: short-chain dehydrogenase/reductase [Beijerinckiaceae bacterium]|nr:MAG: short-chain dehydrogenase/reductase [Beijerinckiaceae bacterium]
MTALDNDRIALVTGGAKRIGAAICRELAQAGYAIILHCNRSLMEAEALATNLREHGARAAIAQGDLADLAALPALYARASAPFGPPTVLVNNASIFLDDSIATIDAAGFSAQLATNLQAPVLLAQAFAAALPADVKGAIVNIIDQRVLRPNPQFLSYSLSKSGLFAATKTLAQALAPRIRVNAVGPGPTLPNLRDGPEGFAREVAGTLLARPVKPEEIARAVRFLAEADSITGQMIAVDSGQHLSWKTPDILE